MRKFLIAGNWKMNMGPGDAAKLAQEICTKLSEKSSNEVLVLVCPTALSIPEVVIATEGSRVLTGAQNMHYESSGAFTGEISAEMLLAAGCRYVVLGHSERRHVFGESDELINRKVLSASRKDLIPILCVGETEVDRDQELTFNVIERQLKKGLLKVRHEDLAEMVIAYEPVWAIGTGRTATPEQAQEVHAFIRKYLYERIGKKASLVPLLYGGSVKPANVADLLKQDDIDGALVGGASLNADSFVALVDAAETQNRNRN